jgi:hypothetical protein
MNINLKELHDARTSRLKENQKTHLICGYSVLITEDPKISSRSYFTNDTILKYIIQNIESFKNKSILILMDALGICAIMMSLLGCEVTICEEERYFSLINKNIELNMNESSNKPKITNKIDNSISYDDIILSEIIERDMNKIFDSIDKYSNWDTKIILGIKKNIWNCKYNILNDFPKNYIRRQMNFFRSNEDIIFELQKKRISWLETYSI